LGCIGSGDFNFDQWRYSKSEGPKIRHTGTECFNYSVSELDAEVVFFVLLR
jgi:hypothetical protein